MHWLFEAKKRYGLTILNYTVTSNHIHLLVVDSDRDVIPKSIQLAAGRTAQEFNKRRNRKGAYWEDRYHATAIEADNHLYRCIAYIDLNMVRAGVVNHPSEWIFSGYNEIQHPPKRYRLIDHKKLTELCGFEDAAKLRKSHKSWAEEGLEGSTGMRDPYWSESIAVGTREFVEETKVKLGYKVHGRKIEPHDEMYVLRETRNSYNTVFEPQKHRLRLGNGHYWRKY